MSVKFLSDIVGHLLKSRCKTFVFTFVCNKNEGQKGRITFDNEEHFCLFQQFLYIKNEFVLFTSITLRDCLLT